jgi:hypothetical protein
MASFEQTFAPVPPPDPSQTAIEEVIAIITLGASIAAAPFFNSGTHLQDNFDATSWALIIQ